MNSDYCVYRYVDKDTKEILYVGKTDASLENRINQHKSEDKFRNIECFLQALFGKSCKVFLENVASPNWRKLQSLGWQLSCQSHSHCRPYLVVTV